jgi:hypothetical protein
MRRGCVGPFLPCAAGRPDQADLARAGTPRVLVGFGPPQYRSLSAAKPTVQLRSVGEDRRVVEYDLPSSFVSTGAPTALPAPRATVRTAHGRHDRAVGVCVLRSDAVAVATRPSGAVQALASLRLRLRGTHTVLRALVSSPK